MILPGLGDYIFKALKEILNGMIGGGSASEFAQKILKTFMKSEEKGVNYVYPVEWINPKGESQK